mgnify:CR=1 FL=1
MKKVGLIGAMVCALGLFAACGDKDNSNSIIGTWSNTAQSYVITIAGAENIPEDMIYMEFSADSVRISDLRCNCIPTWEHYTLTKKDDKRILGIAFGIHAGYYVVEELSNNKMVLTCDENNIDMGCTYIMKQSTAGGGEAQSD